ncbi:hypothetical protein O181_077763 [Austropuccinia psidii MF-1]|uniref:Uncharacterized protein n=1 Tax=Austropuccinia psidii MF-1 TaxID=1389203 RepID=A0A9Q3FHK9_9BASI|nr:hypothetical protein [Austropuccinia psidii MF-1]
MPALPSRCDSDNAPHLHPHHSLRFHTSAMYNPYAPAAHSRYTSYTTLNPPYYSSFPPLTMLILAWCTPDMPPTLPPISALITPYASTPPPRLQDIPPTPPSTLLMPSPTHLILMLSQFPPDMPLMLLPHWPNPQPHLPSLHPCNALKMRLQCLPHLRPHHSLCFCTPATYNPYAPAVPSIYASNATLNPP